MHRASQAPRFTQAFHFRPIAASAQPKVRYLEVSELLAGASWPHTAFRPDGRECFPMTQQDREALALNHVAVGLIVPCLRVAKHHYLLHFPEMQGEINIC